MVFTTNLVFIHYPALKLLVITLVASSLLHDIIYGEVLQAGVFCKSLAVGGLTNPRCTSHDDIWLGPHGVYMSEKIVRNMFSVLSF
jgi:hypothetical protein